VSFVVWQTTHSCGVASPWPNTPSPRAQLTPRTGSKSLQRNTTRSKSARGCGWRWSAIPTLACPHRTGSSPLLRSTPLPHQAFLVCLVVTMIAFLVASLPSTQESDPDLEWEGLEVSAPCRCSPQREFPQERDLTPLAPLPTSIPLAQVSEQLKSFLLSFLRFFKADILSLFLFFSPLVQRSRSRTRHQPVRWRWRLWWFYVRKDSRIWCTFVL